MKKQEHIEYWLRSAENDLKAANTLFRSERYDWCLFIGHLVLKKALKSVFVNNNESKVPPKTHNLVKLAELSSIRLTDEQRLFLDEVNDFNLVTRYPDYKLNFYNLCTRDYAENYFKQIKEYYEWLKSHLK